MDEDTGEEYSKGSAVSDLGEGGRSCCSINPVVFIIDPSHL